MESLNWSHGKESAKARVRLGEDTPVVVEVVSPQVLRQKNIITSGSYGRGRAGHGSRGGPFLVKLQIPSAEFEMSYLDCTVWENVKYRKRNYSIGFRSGNMRVCRI
ncbi:hypothetical protein GOBAR_AA08813 [Gossypium barbadense]|uniref:Uncharacterized protein n=1 Tax=Gossypium barbadense TaxID=3634 RepID=A0A2P5Y8B3_GOSBA|nr:hypothetical protein GOBAR_AA08813 [Gossypium barbadense]